MNRVGFTWRIRPEAMEKYVYMHKNPWPAVQEAIKDSGFNNFSIHMVEHRCFAYFETDLDAATCMANLVKHPVFNEWQDVMTPMQEEESFAGCGQRFYFMEEVYYNP